MFLRSISYISTGFIIFLGIITLIYELSGEKSVVAPQKMYPYFADIKDKIKKIDIHFPDKNISVQYDANGWFVETAEKFPADMQTIDRLFSDIHAVLLIANKTQDNNNFKHLNLLKPSDTEIIHGEGTRFMLYGEEKTPYVDFIVGEKLQSYINPHNVRLFARYSTQGRAYLVQTKSDFLYKPHHFLSRDFGMPSLDDIISAHLTIKNKNAFNIYRVVDDKNKNSVSFYPQTIPKNKKLLYPTIMYDYMLAFIQKLRPVDAMRMTLKKLTTDTQMILQLTKGRTVKMIFWTVNKNHYMQLFHSDTKTPYDAYVYRISDNDYQSFIQPLARFIVDDV